MLAIGLCCAVRSFARVSAASLQNKRVRLRSFNAQLGEIVMGAASKRAKKVRKADEFSVARMAYPPNLPKTSSGEGLWDLPRIMGARRAQSLGNFRQAALLAAAMRTDDALFTAFTNRLAPQRGLPVRLVAPNESARARRVLDEAEALYGPRGVAVAPGMLADVNGALADHGNAFAINVATPRHDGSRIDLEVKFWPTEHVWWDQTRAGFYTRVEGSLEDERIEHGDGRWIVFANHSHEPWKYGVVLPAALVWARHAYGLRDWSKGGTTHGNAKVIGTLPEGIAIDSEDGAAFMRLLEYVSSVDSPYGIKPHGAELEYITNNSQAWQIFNELVKASTASADKIYLGQDGTSNNSGGNYIKSDVLFGVRNDIVEGDLRAIERGLLTGSIEIWTALNFGDSTLAPRREYLMPDADEDARRDGLATRQKSFTEAVDAYRSSGFIVDQAFVDRLASEFGIVSPLLKAPSPSPNEAAPGAPTAPAPAPASPVAASAARRLRGL